MPPGNTATESRAKNGASLTTRDVMNITGLSRRKIENYEKQGICTSVRAGSGITAEKMWTFEQVSMLRNVGALQRGGLALSEIATLAAKGTEAIDQALYLQHVKSVRDERRNLKSVVAHRSIVADMKAIGMQECLYLRYVPSRSHAIIPMRDGRSNLPSGPTFTQLLAELHDVADVVGWCTAPIWGTTVSFNENASERASYAFAEMPNPAMPQVVGRKVIDGGCYRVIARNSSCTTCPDDAACEECARFGRHATDKELRMWADQERAHPNLWNYVEASKQLGERYRTGAWAEGGGIGPALKPQLMPGGIRLPLGVSSCTLPAGVHLCRQCNEEDLPNAFQQLLGMASALRHSPLDEAEELERSRIISSKSDFREWPKKHRETGPFLEPFAAPRRAGNPSMAGWFRCISLSDLQNLTVRTHAALPPQDGFCISCLIIPASNRDAPMRYELQLPVELSEK